MKKCSAWLSSMASRPDIVLAVMLMVAVFMMILPLPTLLIDVLIAINLTMSLVLLTMSIYVREPMEFSVFPSLLLITTLYRLALTVSTSRLILMQQDAGDIVSAFGHFVVGGNLAVGIIVFSIITVVQFIVITKGSERVAEVGARFSLDGMPGKQMSIDGDMRAGTIDAAEARRLRAAVQKESQLYGAMDGAMKFVKGDAIASIIVILVNIVGGVAIGMMQHAMSAGHALSTYAVLSIGDGLVSQIPAFIISISAGVIVTRVPGEERVNLAQDLLIQLRRYPQGLAIAAIVLAGFALVPGFPSFIFAPLAAALGWSAWRTTKSRRGPTASAGTDQRGLATQDEAMKPGVHPVALSVAPGVADQAALGAALERVRWHAFDELGIALSPVPVPATALASYAMRVDIYGEPVFTLQMPPGEVLAEIGSHTGVRPIRVEPLPFGGMALQWFDESGAALVEAEGNKVYRDEERIAHCVSLAIHRFAGEFIGVQETRHLMDAMEERYAELVKELQRQMPVARIAEVLQRLVAEGVSIRDLRTVFETLVEWAPKEKDAVMLVEYVRISLRRQIIRRQKRGLPHVVGWIIGSGIEEQIRESIRQTSAGSYSTLPQECIDAIVNSIASAVSAHPDTSGVLLTAIDVRRFIRKFIERDHFMLPVLSYQELGDDTNVMTLSTIELIEDESEHELA